MKSILFSLYFVALVSFAQEKTVAFQNGEFLKYKIHYGMLNAGFATLETKLIQKNSEPYYHIIGKGWTTGMVKFFFNVNDDYQSYFLQKTNQPYHFIRKINEGGYKKDKEILFDLQKNQAKVLDHKNNTEKIFSIPNDVQDMLSSLYHLRNLDLSQLKKGDVIKINMFFDEEITPVILVFKEKELLKTEFGKVKTLVFKPMVQEGRIFKEKESVTIWITEDKNKIPIKIKANILVGSINAELISYKGLTNPFPIIFN